MAGRHMGAAKKGLSKRAALLILVGIAVAVGLVFFGIQLLEDADDAGERGDASLRAAEYRLPEMQYQGQTFRMRPRLTSILLMGVDHYTTDEQVQNDLRNGGQADFLRLLVIDKDAKKIYQIALDRDTMTPITILGVLGNRAGMRTERLSLSHGFGDGKEESCELTVEAVENLLYGIDIDYYLALEMDGIGELNDWLGGISVTLEDDFTSRDPSMEMGKTMQLNAEQAEIYLRERKSLGIGTNESRMRRQQQYLDQAEHVLVDKLHTDRDAAENLYDSLSSFFTTNMSRGSMVNIVYDSKDYELQGVMQADGEHAVDKEGFMQFVVDEDSLQHIIVEAYYEKVD